MLLARALLFGAWHSRALLSTLLADQNLGSAASPHAPWRHLHLRSTVVSLTFLEAWRHLWNVWLWGSPWASVGPYLGCWQMGCVVWEGPAGAPECCGVHLPRSSLLCALTLEGAVHAQVWSAAPCTHGASCKALVRGPLGHSPFVLQWLWWAAFRPAARSALLLALFCLTPAEHMARVRAGSVSSSGLRRGSRWLC